MRHRTKAICVMALLCGTDQMFGDLLVVDDPQYGASSIVRDTTTGLDWLTLYKTQNLSYNTVFSNFGQGGMFQGFRYADLDDIGTFFADAHVPDIDESNVANFQPVYNLLLEIGALHVGDPCFCDFSYAINDQSLTPGTHNVSELSVNFLPPPSVGEAIRTTDLQANDTFASGLLTGSFIIREAPQPVPEPRSFTVLIAGALGVFWRMCIRRESARKRRPDALGTGCPCTANADHNRLPNGHVDHTLKRDAEGGASQLYKQRFTESAQVLASRTCGWVSNLLVR